MQTIGTFETVQRCNASPRALLLAALDEDDYASEHIPDSHRVDYDQPECIGLIRTLLSRAPAGSPLIVYGRDKDDDRPARVAYRLESEGFGPMHIYADGLAGWRAMSYALAGSGREDHLTLGFAANEAMHHGDWPTTTT